MTMIQALIFISLMCPNSILLDFSVHFTESPLLCAALAPQCSFFCLYFFVISRHQMGKSHLSSLSFWRMGKTHPKCFCRLCSHGCGRVFLCHHGVIVFCFRVFWSGGFVLMALYFYFFLPCDSSHLTKVFIND